MNKVCHMTSAHGPEDERIFHKECVSLAKAGYEVYQVSQGKSYKKNGVCIIGVGEQPAGRLKRMNSFTKKIYQAALALDADLYHFHDPELLPYGLKLKKQGRKVIFDSHEDTLQSILEKEWIPIPMRMEMYLWFKNQQEKVCKRIDGVIAVTPHLVDFFKALNPKTVGIANFPKLEAAPTPSVSRPEVLAFAGGISRQWNHHTIIKAIEKLPECRYLLCGSGSDSYFQELRALSAWERVQYMGVIPHEQVVGLLAGCGVGIALLNPGWNTDWHNGTMGNTKIFEEMMAGLPLVCTDFALWREFVNRWHCGICVDPEDPATVVAAIQYLLDHPEEARQMGKNGRRAVEEEFNWSIEEKKLLALYEEILEA